MRYDTKREQQLIYLFGGKPARKWGTDGTIYNNKPVEVRITRKDNRLRIGQRVHLELLRKNGFYIFDTPDHNPLLFTAAQVDEMLPPGRWYQDRKYPHKFIRVDQIWV